MLQISEGVGVGCGVWGPLFAEISKENACSRTGQQLRKGLVSEINKSHRRAQSELNLILKFQALSATA